MGLGAAGIGDDFRRRRSASVRAIWLGAALASVSLVCAAGALAKGGAVRLVPLRTDPSPVVAYVTQTASSPATVWTVRTDGTGKMRIGPGTVPLIAPSGQQVAASQFGTGRGAETGPALAIYWSDGSGRPPLEFLNLAHETVQPLAWSRDLAYVVVQVQSTAVAHAAHRSGLAIVNIGLDSVKMIARGQIYGASFAPNGSDEVVYGRSASQSPAAPVNLYRSKPDGTSTVALTRDGRSLNPVWAERGVFYDRERLRRNDAPVYQIWMRSPHGPGARQVTHTRVPSLVSGLVPLAVAYNDDGGRLLAEFEGQDTSEAWTVRVHTGRAQRVRVHGHAVQGAGLSADGKTLLIEDGSFLEPASSGRVATIPFFGGRAKVFVAHGSQASWNGRP